MMEEEDGGVGLQELENQDVIEVPILRNSKNVDGVLVPIGATEGGRKASVHILSDDLISTPIDQVLGILQAEWAKIHIFIKLAEAYYKLSRKYPPLSQDAIQFVECAIQTLEVIAHGVADPEVAEHMRGKTPEEHSAYEEQMLTVYNLLAALATQRGMSLSRVEQDVAQNPQQNRAYFFDQARSYIKAADGVRRYAEQTLLNQAWTIMNLSDDVTVPWKQCGYYFKTARRSNEDQSKHRPNLMARLGEAIMAYHGDVNPQAGAQAPPVKGQDLINAIRTAKRIFADVIRQHPRVPASVRVAFGLCCYRLGDFATATFAFKRALEMEPGNKEALLALARTTLMTAKPDEYDTALCRVVRMATAAYKQDPENPCACTSLATYYLNHWMPSELRVQRVAADPKHCTLQADVPDVKAALGDRAFIRVGEHFTAEVDRIEGSTITLKKPFRPTPGEEQGEDVWFSVAQKHLAKAAALADRAKVLTDFDEIKAEAAYILARVSHQLEDLGTAFRHYKEATQLNPDLEPALFGYAQLLAHEGRYLLSQGNADGQDRITEAISVLEKVLSKNPNDADSLHLLGLIYAEVNKGPEHKQAALDKLKKAVETGAKGDRKDTWLAMAQVHQREPCNHQEAKSCYLKAEALMKAKGEPVPYSLYHNLGTLSHHAKELPEARNFYLKALHTYQASGVRDDEGAFLQEEQRIVHPANHVFYTWALVDGLTITPTRGKFEVEANRDDWRELIRPLDHIKLQLGEGPRACFVSEVERDPEGAPLTVKLRHTYLLDHEAPCPVYVKRPSGLLRYATLACVFNLALVQQESGEVQAAKELLQAILRQYPSYTPAYARLAILLDSQGHNDEAIKCIEKACALAPDNMDLVALLGKLDYDAGRKDRAQGKLTKLNETHQDAFSQIALGNMYFVNALELPAKAVKHMGHALNFFHKCLKKTPDNVYAAHGLALVFAEKNDLDGAYKALSMVREKSPDKPEEVLLNLAHVELAMGRLRNATQLYEKYVQRRLGLGKDVSSRCLSFLANAQLKEMHFNGAINSMIKAIFREPTNVWNWFNLAVVTEANGYEILGRTQKQQSKSLAEAEQGLADYEIAKRLYARQDVLARHTRASEKLNYLTTNMNLAQRYVKTDRDRWRNFEDTKKAREEKARHDAMLKEQARLRKEEEEKEAAAKRRSEQEARDEQLRKMKEEWRREAQVQAMGKKKKKKEREDELDESDVEEPDGGRGKEDEEEEGSGDDSSGDDKGGDSSGDEYGFNKKLKKKKAKKGKKGAKGAKGKGKGKGRKGDAAAGSGDEDARKRKAEDGEGGDGKKKRRITRPDREESDGEEEELDLDEMQGTFAAPSTEDNNGGGGGGAAEADQAGAAAGRKKVVQDDEEEDDGAAPMNVDQPEAGAAGGGAAAGATGGADNETFDDLFASDAED